MLEQFTAEATVADNVRKARQHFGVTQKQLSERMAEVGCPLSDAVISGLESGRRQVTVNELAALARAFGFDVNVLLSGPFMAPRQEEEQKYTVLLHDGNNETVTATGIDTNDGWLWLRHGRRAVFAAPQASVQGVRVDDE